MRSNIYGGMIAPLIAAAIITEIHNDASILEDFLNLESWERFEEKNPARAMTLGVDFAIKMISKADVSPTPVTEINAEFVQYFMRLAREIVDLFLGEQYRQVRDEPELTKYSIINGTIVMDESGDIDIEDMRRRFILERVKFWQIPDEWMIWTRQAFDFGGDEDQERNFWRHYGPRDQYFVLDGRTDVRGAGETFDAAMINAGIKPKKEYGVGDYWGEGERVTPKEG